MGSEISVFGYIQKLEQILLKIMYERFQISNSKFFYSKLQNIMKTECQVLLTLNITLITTSGGLNGFCIKWTSSGVKGHMAFLASVIERNSRTASSSLFCNTWTKSYCTSRPTAVIPWTFKIKVSSLGLVLLSFSPKLLTRGLISLWKRGKIFIFNVKYETHIEGFSFKTRYPAEWFCLGDIFWHIQPTNRNYLTSQNWVGKRVAYQAEERNALVKRSVKSLKPFQIFNFVNYLDESCKTALDVSWSRSRLFI